MLAFSPMSAARGPRYAFLAALLALILCTVFSCARSEETAPADSPADGAPIIVNGGFEEGGSPAPAGWSFDEREMSGKGRVSQDRSQFHSGSASLKLEPTSRNSNDHPLAVGQFVSVGAYRGQKLEFSVFMKAEGGASAQLSLLTFVRGRPVAIEALIQPSGSDWRRQAKAYTVPDDSTAQVGVVCSVSGKSGAAWFDDVAVAQVNPSAATVPSEPAESAMKASVNIDASTVIRQIPATLYGTNVEWIWNANGLWLPDRRQIDPTLLHLARDLHPSLIRYPGGVYSDFYQWRRGIGALEKRSEANHLNDSTDKSRVNFGTDEALQFASDVGGELLITVNAGTGSAQDAADWVRYVNGSKQRVRFWEVGNELYINDGSPVSGATTVDPRTYAQRFQDFAQQMRASDGSIKLLAISGENQGYPNWNQVVLGTAGAQIDFLAVHNAYAPVNASNSDDLRTVYRAMFAAPITIRHSLDRLSQQIEEYAPTRAPKIGIAVTEWGPFFQADVQGRYAQHTNSLGSALYVASLLKTFIETPKVSIANFHVLNDLSIMGWIGSTDSNFPPAPKWTPTARYYAFQMFRDHFGERLLQSNVTSPTFDAEPAGMIPEVKGVPYLDVVSSLSADGHSLYVLAINKSFDSSIQTSLAIQGFRPNAGATSWTLTGSSVDANTGTVPLQLPGMKWATPAEDSKNPRFRKGGPGEVTLTSASIAGVGPTFSYSFPAHSVTSLVLTRP